MKTNKLLTLLTACALAIPFVLHADTATKEAVNVHNFARAESDLAIKKLHEMVGLGKFLHLKQPTQLDKQTIIRMNRDTLYSAIILDLTKPATIIMPETNGRYMSMQVISQDHYTYAESKPGTYTITQENLGSRYAYVSFRIFADAQDPKDVAKANVLQDALQVKGGQGTLELPDWNTEQILEAREALNTLGKLGISTSRAFGMPNEVDPIDHLVMSASGWGGLPEKYAFYTMATVDKPDGTPYKVTLNNVPVRAFWSITVYGADGFIHENKLGAYSYNSANAKQNRDGSTTINFGNCDDGRINCLPIEKGWNYAIRLYEPEPEILDGSWTFPDIVPAL